MLNEFAQPQIKFVAQQIHNAGIVGGLSIEGATLVLEISIEIAKAKEYFL